MANTDPLQSLLDYIQDVKPYHTKVLETTMTYTYEEPVYVTVKDSWKINVIWHTLGDTDPMGYIYGGGAHEICPGVGWDTNSWDTTMWDYPYVCDLLDPRRVYVTITETFTVRMVMTVDDQVYTTVYDGTGGWDIPPWDTQPWDLYTLGFHATDVDQEDDASSASITETFVLTWTDTDGSTGTIGMEA